MKRLTTCVYVAAVCAVGFLAASPAQAQTTPKPDFGFGYQVTRVPDNNLPVGWFADVSFPVANTAVSIVGEASGAYKSESVSAGGVTANANVKLHTFQGGVRISSRTNPSVTPFGQVLAGAIVGSGGISISAPGASASAGDTETHLALQIGVGVNAMATARFGFRVGADFRRVFVSGGGENEFRVVAGVVIPFGQ